MNRKNTHTFVIVLFTALILFLSFYNASAETRQLRILHMNDFHGCAMGQKLLGSEEIQGGVSSLATLVTKLRQEKPTLLLAAGDMIQGNTWTNLFQGRPVIEIMNAMRFDAMALGNHEFDFGQRVLRERISEARFSILGANVTGIPELKPYIIKTLGGARVGIIGVVTEDAPTATHPSNVAGLTFLSVPETVAKYVKLLRSDVDIIVVLSHIGFNADMNLANTVKGIDVIVGGHTHTKNEKPMRIGETIIVQAWEHGLALGVLDLTIQDGKVIEVTGRLEEIKPSTMKKDENIEGLVEKYASQMKTMMGTVIGKSYADLDGVGVHVRTRETNLGDLVSDIMRETAQADAAIMNGGGIRTSIKKGDITVNDIYTVLPFDNYIVAIELTGKQIREALEYGVSAVEAEEGRFPQISGIAFTYWPSKKNGSRIDTVTVNGKPLDPQRLYKVATSDFLAVGGDGYQVFRDAIRESPDFSSSAEMLKGSRIVYNDAGRWLRDAAVQYIKEKKEISQRVEGRIRELR